MAKLFCSRLHLIRNFKMNFPQNLPHSVPSDVERRNSSVRFKFANFGRDFDMNAYDLIKGNISTYVIHFRKYYGESCLILILVFILSKVSGFAVLKAGRPYVQARFSFKPFQYLYIYIYKKLQPVIFLVTKFDSDF